MQEAEISRGNNFKFADHDKANKFWLHWFSKMSINCKRNTITGELQGAKIISSDFNI